MGGASAALARWALVVELKAGEGAPGEALDGGGLHGGEGCQRCHGFSLQINRLLSCVLRVDNDCVSEKWRELLLCI